MRHNSNPKLAPNSLSGISPALLLPSGHSRCSWRKKRMKSGVRASPAGCRVPAEGAAPCRRPAGTGGTGGMREGRGRLRPQPAPCLPAPAVVARLLGLVAPQLASSVWWTSGENKRLWPRWCARKKTSTSQIMWLVHLEATCVENST